MMSALLRSASVLALVLAATACQPQDGQGTGETPVTEAPAPDPVSDPDGLSLNDVSILLPPPTSTSDPVLAITDLGFDGSPVWPDAVFQQFLALANSDAGAVSGVDVANNTRGSRIDVSAFADKAVWHVASVRIDPGAPGLSPEIAEAFGQQPQIRLVLQPVTSGPVVHDVAAHLIYSYTEGAAPPLPGCLLPRFQPDEARFGEIVDDVVAMKASLARGEIGGEVIDTSGPLGIHPAADAGRETRVAFRDALKGFLESHLDPTKLRAMAVMGLPGERIPEPWIFLAMAPDPRTGNFAPLPNPALAQDRLRFAQMLDARPDAIDNNNPSVSPAVRVNNLAPITCAFEVPVNPSAAGGPTPPANPTGVSTAELFPDANPARMREIVDVVADPTQAHFFNTDCVSCHTETRREMDILGTNQVDAPVDPAVLPTELWNVRNFGWFPPFPNGRPLATVTRRTATETFEVVEAINADLRER